MVMDADKVDGQLFLGDNLPPDAAARYQRGSGQETDLWGTQPTYEIVDPDNGVLYERVLLLTKDPTTLPHSRAKCSKWVRIGTAKICVGWTVNWQWYYVRAVLRVSTANPIDIKDIVEDCLREGAIAAAIAAIITGGGAAAAAAGAAVEVCLTRKLSDQLLTVTVKLEHFWGEWQ
ncbi:hypothetical protein [Sphingomonas faeni]|uniref:hypothetical protein n=1 Tax=Sphingomonas faeni TaxID=185950 RepID=UPI003347A6FC